MQSHQAWIPFYSSFMVDSHPRHQYQLLMYASFLSFSLHELQGLEFFHISNSTSYSWKTIWPSLVHNQSIAYQT